MAVGCFVGLMVGFGVFGDALGEASSFVVSKSENGLGAYRYRCYRLMSIKATAAGFWECV